MNFESREKIAELATSILNTMISRGEIDWKKDEAGNRDHNGSITNAFNLLYKTIKENVGKP